MTNERRIVKLPSFSLKIEIVLTWAGLKEQHYYPTTDLESKNSIQKQKSPRNRTGNLIKGVRKRAKRRRP